MGGFKDELINSQVATGILEDVISKVLQCCHLMVKDCLNNGIKISNHEEDIRDYLFHRYLDRDDIAEKLKFNHFRFFTEVPVHYVNSKPKGRTDINVYNEDWFHFRKKYFTIECKRLDGSSKLNRAYLKDGVERFVGGHSPLYSSYFKKNCMFGFIVQEIDIHDNMRKINDLQVNGEYNRIKVLKEMECYSNCENIYTSSYLAGNDTIQLYHLLYDFSEIID